MKIITSEIKTFLVERGWHTLRPSDLAKSISIEAAELLEIFQWTSMDIEELKQDIDKLERTKKEIADVCIYALQLVALLDLDAEEIIRAKLDQVNKKYPAELMRKNAQTETGSGDDPEYWRIKYASRDAERS